MGYDRDNLEFKVSLESIGIIEYGLDLKEGDNSLAVCSSGHVPLALSYYGKVVAVDQSQTQLRYAESWINNFGNGGRVIPEEYQKYVNARRVNNYFVRKGRIQDLRMTTGRISFVRRNLFESIPQGEFDKVYLSNILDWRLRYSDEQKRNLIRKLVSRMPNGGMICSVGVEGIDLFDRLSLKMRIPIMKRGRCFDFPYSFYEVAPKNL